MNASYLLLLLTPCRDRPLDRPILWTLPFQVHKKKNQPPTLPVINFPAEGETNERLTLIRTGSVLAEYNGKPQPCQYDAPEQNLIKDFRKVSSILTARFLLPEYEGSATAIFGRSKRGYGLSWGNPALLSVAERMPPCSSANGLTSWAFGGQLFCFWGRRNRTLMARRRKVQPLIQPDFDWNGDPEILYLWMYRSMYFAQNERDFSRLWKILSGYNQRRYMLACAANIAKTSQNAYNHRKHFL